MQEKSPFESLTARGGFMEHELGKGWSAPFTGYTWKALRAFVDLVECWYAGDAENRAHAENAMRSLAKSFQPRELPAVRMTIYGRGNEQAMLQLWPHIAPRTECPF